MHDGRCYSVDMDAVIVSVRTIRVQMLNMLIANIHAIIQIKMTVTPLVTANMDSIFYKKQARLAIIQIIFIKGFFHCLEIQLYNHLCSSPIFTSPRWPHFLKYSKSRHKQ